MTAASTMHLTRQQRHMSQAFDHISDVVTRYPDPASNSSHKQVRDIYGGLCHSFPVLVRTCGLCQALAFVEAKAAPTGERGQAYRLLRDHVAAVLGTETKPLETVRTALVADYMRHTRTVIDAWIFYKRFAASILKVESAQKAEDGMDGSV